MDCVGVLDSGLGGISTLSCLMNILPNENYIYVADKSFAPYGNKSEDFVLERINEICRYFKRLGAKAVVIACNTATSCSIESMRAHGDMLYVGVEPPVKPACEELSTGKALVLLTERTSKQEKFLALKAQYNDKIIVGVEPFLATLIESNINNLSKLMPYVRQIHSLYSSENIESVALGCTHYCLIKNYFQEVFKAKVYDSNSGTAIRLYNLLKQSKAINRSGGGVKLVTF